MAQASAAARLLRQRPCDPTAAGMLSSRVINRFLSSSSASPTWAPRRPKQPAASAASTACSSSSSSSRTISRSLCAWFGSHPRRELNAASAATTRALHHALSTDSSAATVSMEATTPASQSQLLGFIKSTFGALEGQNHCWLNAANGIWRTFDKEGIYLVLLYQSCGTLDSQNKRSAAFERLKFLQQRYPHLNVFALQFGSAASSLAAQSQAVRTIMKEYITFPILLSDKDFTNMTNGACYLLFEGSKDHILSVKLDEEPELMTKGLEGFTALSAEPSENVLESKVSWQKEEVIKEPYVGSLRNLLLYHPGCVSVDEDGDRIFISDSNHHRIIISNSDGIIIDFIGSSPGFEDGKFEYAKLLQPAASFYHAAEDCLYIVDSENHAVRKADFSRRFLETVYPVFNKKSSGIWSWITDKLGLTKEVASNIQDFDADSVTFPWHLLQISEDDLLVADRNFETSWILNMSTGEKQDIAKGRAEAMELCQQTINERRALLKDILMNGSLGDKEHSYLENISCNEILSSISRFQKYVVFCDTDGQRVLKHDLDTRDTSNIHFTNLGVLGLPYWFVCSLERVSTWGHSVGQFREHTRKVNVLPGRCNIKVSVDIPVDTELATPLVESCIWRQVRGSGAEISESDGQDTNPEKVGIAQQWYDEIDNLAFSEAAEEPAAHKGDDDKPGDGNYQDQKTVHFTCAINVSPGTCELVASAALYLKIDRSKSNLEDQKAVIKRILQCQGREEHAGVELLTGSSGGDDATGLVLMKPVHLRLRLDCADHPAGATNKETINTESSLEIIISLD